MQGYLILADGTIYAGTAFGAIDNGQSQGEVVFNTSMTGYQELLSDPSYAGQIVVMTYPLIGNYGVNPEDNESKRVQVRGLIVRELCHSPSHWQAVWSLGDYLKKQNIIGLEGIDTRALTRHIRQQGTVNGIICAGSRTPAELTGLVQRAQKDPGLEQVDLAAEVTTQEPYVLLPTPGSVDPLRRAFVLRTDQLLCLPQPEPGSLRLVVIDYGAKHNILRALAWLGCQVVVVPKQFSVPQIQQYQPDGIVLSNGPGNPKAVNGATATARELIATGIPLLGICLGHQILGLALGGETRKMLFGHRGGNHPVSDLRTGRIYITSQNHGYVLEENSLNPELVEIIARNGNDGTLEGFRHRTLPILSVQYHPEGNPGPDDSLYVLHQFLEMVSARKNG